MATCPRCKQDFVDPVGFRVLIREDLCKTCRRREWKDECALIFVALWAFLGGGIFFLVLACLGIETTIFTGPAVITPWVLAPVFLFLSYPFLRFGIFLIRNKPPKDQ